MLLHLYFVHAWGQTTKTDAEAPRGNGTPNGMANGHARVDRRVRDAEEFELEGLMSDEEDIESPIERKERLPLAT